MVTVTVLGIVLASAAPSIVNSVRAYPLRGAARDVYAQLQNARMIAVTENKRMLFVVDGATTYRIVDDANRNDAADDGETVYVNHSITAAGQGITISAGGPIAFAANGTTAAYATVNLQNSFGDTMQVAVAPAGQLRIQ